jgi:hypothetical protein
VYQILTKTTAKDELGKIVGEKIILDAETKLPFGMGFDSYIYAKKGERNIKKVDKSYALAIIRIINKFKLKSEP